MIGLRAPVSPRSEPRRIHADADTFVVKAKLVASRYWWQVGVHIACEAFPYTRPLTQSNRLDRPTRVGLHVFCRQESVCMFFRVT